MKQPIRIIHLDEVCRRTGRSAAAIYRQMNASQFPRSVPLSPGGRYRGWLEHEVDEYLAKLVAERDSGQMVPVVMPRGVVPKGRRKKREAAQSSSGPAGLPARDKVAARS
nr:AlpA family phage regulatory protein [Nitrosomonas nitrosa]